MERETLLLIAIGCLALAFLVVLFLYGNLKVKHIGVVDDYQDVIDERNRLYLGNNALIEQKRDLEAAGNSLKASLSALRMEETELNRQNAELQERIKYYDQRVLDMSCREDEWQQRCEKLLYEKNILRKQLATAKGLATRYKNELKKYKPF